MSRFSSDRNHGIGRAEINADSDRIHPQTLLIHEPDTNKTPVDLCICKTSSRSASPKCDAVEPGKIHRKL
jgi:hypothetical protein